MSSNSTEPVANLSPALSSINSPALFTTVFLTLPDSSKDSFKSSALL